MTEEFPFHPYRQKITKLHIDIDATTLNRTEEYMKGVISSIEANRPFVIFHDQKDFLLSLPQFRLVICFAGGILQTKEVCSDLEKYVNRVKMGMFVYENFSTVDDFWKNMPAIENVYLLSKK